MVYWVIEMSDPKHSETSGLVRPVRAVIATIAVIGAVMTLDYVTGPTANLSILYFLPITYAAWALGRTAAFGCALLADIPHYADQLALASAGHHSNLTAIVNIVVRLLVYAFVAEAVCRLAATTEAAKQSAVRLAALNDDLLRSYADLEDDVSAAGMLQASTLVPSPVEVPGCAVGAAIRYARKTGGDFADAGETDGLVYACVADIAGKGTPAALFTALLKYLLNDAVNQGARGVAVVNKINESLCRLLPPEKFVTLFYAEIDPTSGRVDYVNAGHVEALVYRSGTGNLEAAKANAPLLGFRGLPAETSTSSLHLNCGDVLVLYTDGAVESVTLSGGRLGNEPIRRLVTMHAHLHPGEMAEVVTDELQAMTIADRRDDMVVLCVKMTGGRGVTDPERNLPLA